MIITILIVVDKSVCTNNRPNVFYTIHVTNISYHFIYFVSMIQLITFLYHIYHTKTVFI